MGIRSSHSTFLKKLLGVLVFFFHRLQIYIISKLKETNLPFLKLALNKATELKKKKKVFFFFFFSHIFLKKLHI